MYVKFNSKNCIGLYVIDFTSGKHTVDGNRMQFEAWLFNKTTII